MRAQLQRLLAQGRDGALLRFGLGQACLQDGDSAEAAVHLRQAVTQDPRYSAAWKLLGQALHKQGLNDDARTAWTQGLAVAEDKGDKQAGKEIVVFLKRLDKPAR